MTTKESKRPRSSRKAALTGQLTAMQLAQNGLSDTMQALDDMSRSMAPSAPEAAASAAPAGAPAETAPAPAPDTPVDRAPVTPAPRPAAPATATAATPDRPPAPTGAPPTVETLAELQALIEAATDTIMVSVPVTFVTGSPDNHRDFALDFATFLKYLPPCPEDWRDITPEQYVMYYWQEALSELRRQGVLNEHRYRKASTQLADAFEIAQSIQSSVQLHTPNAYLRFAADGQPDHIELIAGEQRVRGYRMIGRTHTVMAFAPHAATKQVDPALEYERQRLRVMENTKSTALTPDQRLRALQKLLRALADKVGAETVAQMSTTELVEEFRTSINLSRTRGHQYLRVVRNPQCELLIDLCARLGLSVDAVAELAGHAYDLAERRGRSTLPVDVYACAVANTSLAFTLQDVPAELRDDPQLQLNGTTLAQRAMEAATAETGAGVSRRRQRGERSPAAKRLQQELGWSISKGPSHAEAHRNLFTNAMLLVTLIEAPVIPPVRVEQLRELARLQGSPSELDNFREGLAALMADYKLPFEALNRSYGEAHQLLDRLAAGENALEVIRSYFPMAGERVSDA